ncbi:Putative cyanovirin-N [Colletotrichum destructivum]|uniref:Cyanovirin-N n=1 Tax=Colletotrichum destructivum TaxID=34406 RepID=A0AAX4I8N6_9PEZI|nr:Putative cyanovirin-N [Colletotrichum destructivum]
MTATTATNATISCSETPVQQTKGAVNKGSSKDPYAIKAMPTPVANTTFSKVTMGLVPRSGFKGTCANIHGDSGDPAVIWACCRTPTGWGVQNRFDLSKCLQNVNGTLTPHPAGHFRRGCGGCAIQDPFKPTIYTCKCGTDVKNGPQQFVDTTVDLNDFIGNHEGALFCHGVNEKRLMGTCAPRFV